ncbi:MAG: Nif3-like dinuclear metal center hexameric protein [Flavobacteriales bacterium]
MQLSELISFLEQIAPPNLQESYDNSGLLVGDRELEVDQAMVCVDCTEEVVDDALNKNCQLIIAHHPIIFGGLKSLTGKNYIERTVIKAIKNNIAIYAAHTNMDNVKKGVNARISDHLGLENRKILSPKKGNLKKLAFFCPTDKANEVRNKVCDAGAGAIGDYDQCSYNLDGFGTFRGLEGANPYVGEKGKVHQENERRVEVIYSQTVESKVLKAMFETHPYEEIAYDIYSLENENPEVGSGMIGELNQSTDEQSFLQFVKKNMKTDCIRHTPLRNKPIKKVAVCGGAGSFLLNEAKGANADAFITSDFKYHQFFDAENEIVICDIGHYESEQFTMDLFKDELKKKFPKFAIHLTSINTNPVNYFY